MYTVIESLYSLIKITWLLIAILIAIIIALIVPVQETKPKEKPVNIKNICQPERKANALNRFGCIT